jgi:glycosyltransferase involved in cell wall biosynthesis
VTGSQRRRVAVVGLDAAAPGSVPGIARWQAELLAEEFDVTLLARSVPAAESYRAVSVPTPSFVGLHRFGHVARELWASRRLRSAIFAEHRARSLDVVIFHTHTLAALCGPALAAAGVRSILVAHADIRLRPAGAYDPLLTRLYRWSNPRSYRRVDRVIALSTEYARLAREGLDRPDRVRVIPCPVDGPWAGRERPARTGVAPVRIGYAGRLSVEKGLPSLIDAIAEIARGGLELRLGIAGDGALREPLTRQALDVPPAGSVTLHGWLSGAELETFYEELDLFCQPSISETQGLAVLEALLRRVPVVASRVGGLADAIRPGLDGELCEPGDTASLVAALRRAIARLGEGGYRVPDLEWMERYSPRGHQRAVSELIRELIREPAG